MAGAVFWVLPVEVSRSVRGPLPREGSGEGEWEREEFLAYLASAWSDLELAGIDEGTVLSPDAEVLGEGTESWTLDAGEAPRERDWIAAQAVAKAQLYFPSESRAREAARRLQGWIGVAVGDVFEQAPQDWDASWKKAFLDDPEGVRIAPFWRILPPWVSDGQAGVAPGERVLRINPGAGFGTGTHETSQLCLQALAESVNGAIDLLDFGSGSGILSIGGALLGARALGVEIDALANENARDNAALNGVQGRARFVTELPAEADGRYPVVVANILRPILAQFAPRLARLLAPGGTLILSGLIEADLPEIREVYGRLLAGRAGPVERAKNEWRCLIWR